MPRGIYIRSPKELKRLRAAMKQNHQAHVNPEAALNRAFSNYRIHAREKSLEFSITKVQFKELASQPCTYCGSKPSNVTTAQSGDQFVYNGLDRRDNSQGYTKDNSVTCCRTCNWMKSDLSVSEFITKVYQIAEWSELCQLQY